VAQLCVFFVVILATPLFIQKALILGYFSRKCYRQMGLRQNKIQKKDVFGGSIFQGAGE
jgi:hypothetical protein